MNRKQKRLFRYAVDTFVQILSKITNRKFVKYKANDKDTVGFEYWLEYFGSNVGEEFVKRFLEFSCTNYLDKSRSVDVYRNARVFWFFSKEMIRRWEKINPQFGTLLIRKFRIENNVHIVKRESKLSQIVLTVKPYEEKVKERFYGENKGFFWCRANTTLYFRESSLCRGCKFATECKELLKKEYPKVYKQRGYDE